MILISSPHSFDSIPLLTNSPICVSTVKQQEKLYQTNGHLWVTSQFQGNQDFVRLYNKFRRTSDYNKIKMSSQQCPYCEVNQSTTIDHVLAKVNYPEFSIFWFNLVPCCSDCNRNKGIAPLFFHPYVKSAVPCSSWLTADFQFDNTSKNIYFQFSVAGNQADIIEFFNKLKLSNLYTSEAGKIYTNSIRSWITLEQTNRTILKEHCIESSKHPANIVNRAIYQALLADWKKFINMLPNCDI